MGRPYELIVFDWEGTIGDPLGYLLNAIDEQASFLGMPPIDRSLARQYIQQGLEFALKKLLPDLSTQRYTQLLENIQHLSQSMPKDQCVFEGAQALVACIQNAGLSLAIATNKGHQSLQRVLHATGMEQFFTITRSAGQVPAKPCPQMLEEIMAVFSCSAEQTLMIGDSVSDVEMATSIHVGCLGVDFYGYQKESLLQAGALAVFNDYTEVARFLELTNDSSFKGSML